MDDLHRAEGASRSRDDGFTLVETLVVVGLLAVVVGITATTFTSLLRTTDGVRARNEATEQLRTATDAITRNLRSAARPSGQVTPIVGVAQHNLFVTTSMLGANPEPMWVAVGAFGGRLYEQVRAPDGNGRYPTSNIVRTRVLAEDLVAASDLMFRYFSHDEHGNRVALPFDAFGRLSAADRDRVEVVVVTVAVRPDAGRVEDRTAEITTEVRLPNVQFERR